MLNILGQYLRSFILLRPERYNPLGGESFPSVGGVLLVPRKVDQKII
jgi:hypothetical protein